jgi:hypothetical protein
LSHLAQDGTHLLVRDQLAHTESPVAAQRGERDIGIQGLAQLCVVKRIPITHR